MENYVCMMVCPVCLQDSGIVLDKYLKKRWKYGDRVMGDTPCSVCEERMKDHIAIMVVKDGTTSNPFDARTGATVFIKDEAFKSMFEENSDLLEKTLKIRAAFVEEEAVRKMGINPDDGTIFNQGDGKENIKDTTEEEPKETLNRTRKLASHCIVSSIDDIEGSDFLQLCKLEGKFWNIVVKKGSLNVGDRVVFFEVDSYLPIKPVFEFLRDRNYKKLSDPINGKVYEGFWLRTATLRGVVSQGLVLPLESLVEDYPEIRDTILTSREGDDLTDILGVKHYDELRMSIEEVGPSGGAKYFISSFPQYIVPKTDEERIHNISDIFSGRYDDMLLECTEKEDGTSCTVYYSPSSIPDSPFGVCSRNNTFRLEYEEGEKKPASVALIEALGLRERMEKYGKDLAIQGEIVGPGIQSNRNKYAKLYFKVFRIYSPPTQKWLTPEERYVVCKDLEIDHVEVVSKGDTFVGKLKSIDGFIGFSKRERPNGTQVEGLVFKSVNSGFSFKVLNPNYLLKHKL